jgi:hypothetical protein
MKMSYLIMMMVMLAAVFSSCQRKVVIVKRTPAPHRLPPGQAKKITGAQSARAYAPGHQKKKG